MTDGLTVYCSDLVGNGLLVLLCGDVIIGRIGEKLCCVLLGNVSTFSSLTKCEDVCIFFVVPDFVVPFRFFFVFINVEFGVLINNFS